MANDARQQLLDYLDKHAFDPVLKASLGDYQTEDKKKELRDVQGTTQSTKHRYHTSYTSAAGVYHNYQDDLSSDAAQSVDHELNDLGLPTLRSIKPGFEALVHKLGVS